MRAVEQLVVVECRGNAEVLGTHSRLGMRVDGINKPSIPPFFADLL